MDLLSHPLRQRQLQLMDEFDDNQTTHSSSFTGKREREIHKKIDSEQIEEDIDIFKTEHRMKDLGIFKKSLNMHSQQLEEHLQGMTQAPIKIKNKLKGRTKSVTEYPDSMFQLRYTYYEYLCKNKMAKESGSVDFIPYKDDDFCVDYQSYSKYFDDLSFIENGNNSAKKSGYSKFTKYYLDLWAETIYRNMVERISEKYGENDQVLTLIAEDFMREYENENSELFVMSEDHLQYDRKKFRLKILQLFQEQLSNYSIFKREHEQKSQSMNGSLESIWSITAKLFCYKCMRFDCAIHRVEYDTCIRDPDDARATPEYNNEISIGAILEKLFKTQNSLLERKQYTLKPCSSDCYLHCIKEESISDSYNDWTRYDKEIALNTIFIYGERFLENLNNTECTNRDVFCQMADHHIRPCREIKKFICDWFLNFKIKNSRRKSPPKNKVEELAIMRGVAKSFLKSEELDMLQTQVAKKINPEKVIFPNLHKPMLYNPCQCAIMNVSECACVKNGTFCTELCNCFTEKNRFKNHSCAGAKCICKKYQRSCVGDCGCKNSCQNSFAKHFMKRCAVGFSQLHGLGLFSLEPIKKDELIVEYVGEIVSILEENRRSVIYDMYESSYLFELNENMSVDAFRKGNESRFLNDAQGKMRTSKTNNCIPKIVYDTNSHDYRIGIYALKDIDVHSELLFSYGDRFWKNCK